MKITRRLFLLLAFVFSTACFAQTHLSSDTAYVGTYTDKTGSKGIYALTFDPLTGKLTDQRLVAETPNPSWVLVHPNGKFLYAANESGKQSAITTFSINPQTKALTQLNQVPSGGEDPCHLAFDKTGKFLFAANYTSGTVAVFPILPNGKLGEHTVVAKDSGTLGPNKERQEGPHAHWVQVSADNRELLVADLGLDRVLVYDFDAAKGTLVFHNEAAGAKPNFAQNNLELAPGSGPRHVAISRSRDPQSFVYVLGEIDSTVTLLSRSKEGVFTSVQKVPMLPNGFSGRNEAAEIEIHPNGKFLYASNRGLDSIAVFSINHSSGALTSVGSFPTGGKEPRHFAIDPTGHYLLAENENTNSIVVFRIDSATGALSQVSTLENIPGPVCLTFYQAN